MVMQKDALARCIIYESLNNTDLEKIIDVKYATDIWENCNCHLEVIITKIETSRRILRRRKIRRFHKRNNLS